MSMIFGLTPPPPKTHASCKSPRWQWDKDGQRWVCLVCYTGNPDDWREPEPDNIYAGFIDQPVAYRATGRCMICDAKEARR